MSLVRYLNSQCGAQLSLDVSDFVKPEPKEEARSPEFAQLMNCFELLNEFKIDEAKAALTVILESDNARQAAVAQKLLAKLAVLGEEVPEQIEVTKWLTTLGPSLKEDDVFTLVARLDYRDSHSHDLSLQLERAAQAGVQVIRLTGTDYDLVSEGDVNYHVAVHEGGLFARAAAMETMHGAVLIRNRRIVWIGHVGIMNDVLLESIKSQIHGKKPKPACDGDGEEELCAKPHDEL